MEGDQKGISIQPQSPIRQPNFQGGVFFFLTQQGIGFSFHFIRVFISISIYK
jgi:hypothetical protein